MYVCEGGQDRVKINKTLPITSKRQDGRAARPSHKPGTLPGVHVAFSIPDARAFGRGAQNALKFFCQILGALVENIILGAKETEAKSIPSDNREHNAGNPTIRMWSL